MQLCISPRCVCPRNIHHLLPLRGLNVPVRNEAYFRNEPAKHEPVAVKQPVVEEESESSHGGSGDDEYPYHGRANYAAIGLVHREEVHAEEGLSWCEFISWSTMKSRH